METKTLKAKKNTHREADTQKANTQTKVVIPK